MYFTSCRLIVTTAGHIARTRSTAGGGRMRSTGGCQSIKLGVKERPRGTGIWEMEQLDKLWHSGMSIRHDVLWTFIGTVGGDNCALKRATAPAAEPMEAGKALTELLSCLYPSLYRYTESGVAELVREFVWMCCVCQCLVTLLLISFVVEEWACFKSGDAVDLGHCQSYVLAPS